MKSPNYIILLSIFVVIQFVFANQISFAKEYKTKISLSTTIHKDSVIITTFSGNQYVGVITKKEDDGYFVIVNKREIYISKFEVKSIFEMESEISDKDSLVAETSLKMDNISEVSATEEKLLDDHSEQSKKHRISLKRSKSLSRRSLKISNPKIKKGITIGSVLGTILLFMDDFIAEAILSLII